MGNAISLMDSYSMTNTFFYIDKTKLFFPKLVFQKNNIPVGDSVTMCVSVSWATKDHGNNYDIMRVVNSFPRCVETESGKFIWSDDDPLFGINVPVWKQMVYDIDCYDDEDCERTCRDSYQGGFIGGKLGKKCYTYQVN